MPLPAGVAKLAKEGRGRPRTAEFSGDRLIVSPSGVSYRNALLEPAAIAAHSTATRLNTVAQGWLRSGLPWVMAPPSPLR